MTHQCIDCGVMITKEYKAVKITDIPPEVFQRWIDEPPKNMHYVFCLKCWKKRGNPNEISYAQIPFQRKVERLQQKADEAERGSKTWTWGGEPLLERLCDDFLNDYGWLFYILGFACGLLAGWLL